MLSDASKVLPYELARAFLGQGILRKDALTKQRVGRDAHCRNLYSPPLYRVTLSGRCERLCQLKATLRMLTEVIFGT